MSKPRYRPGLVEPVLYLFFWFFQTWGWVLLFLFLGWKLVGCWVPEVPDHDPVLIEQLPVQTDVI